MKFEDWKEKMKAQQKTTSTVSAAGDRAGDDNFYTTSEANAAAIEKYRRGLLQSTHKP